MSENTEQVRNMDSSRHSNSFNRQRTACPYCGEFARIRTRIRISQTSITGVLECTNDDCMWSGKYTMTIRNTTRVSKLVDENRAIIELPISSETKKALEAEADRRKQFGMRGISLPDDEPTIS